MLRDLLAYGPTALAWAAVAYKLPALRRRPRDPALRAYWLTLLALAAALTVLLPPVYLAIDGLTGIPNLARLLGHGLILATGCAVRSFVGYLSYPDAAARPDPRRSVRDLAVALALLAVLFGLAPVDEESLDFMSR